MVQPFLFLSIRETGLVFSPIWICCLFHQFWCMELGEEPKQKAAQNTQFITKIAKTNTFTNHKKWATFSNPDVLIQHIVSIVIIKVHIIFTRLILLNRLCLNLPIYFFIDKKVVPAYSEWSSSVFCWRFNQRMFGQRIPTSVTQYPDTYLCAFNLFLLVFLPRLLHREGRQRMWPRTIFFSTPLLSTGLLSRSFIEHSSAALHQPQVNIVVIYHADGGRVESVTLER